eukprot:scpid39215/ scgid5159/ 
MNDFGCTCQKRRKGAIILEDIEFRRNVRISSSGYVLANWSWDGTASGSCEPSAVPFFPFSPLFSFHACISAERTTEPLPTSEAVEATEIPETIETMAVELETTAAALTTVAATSPTTTRPAAAALVKGNQCWLRETSRREIVDVYNRVRTIPSYDCGEVEIGTEEHSSLTQQHDLRRNTVRFAH